MNSLWNRTAAFGRLSSILGLLIVVGTLAFQFNIASAELIHRYSFQDAANDSAGKVNGKLEGDAKVADGKLVLTNTGKKSDDAKLAYLSFGERILPKTGSATIEVWFTSKSDGQFARVFDFGQRGQGYLFLTVDEGSDAARTAISDNAWENEATTRSDSPVNDNKPHMAAVVIDGAAKRLRFYIDGKQHGESEPLGDNSLEKIKGANNWLGRSLYTTDAGFTGSIDELRIYDTPLSADDIAKHFKAGADAVDEAKK
jgi:hypothetical protein